MSNTIALSVIALPQVVAGKFVDRFAVVDQAGELVGAKAHNTKEEAEAELGTLKFYATGLEFARATAPEGASAKSLVGKANIVASFLLYQEQLESGEAVADTAEADEAAVTVQENDGF